MISNVEKLIALLDGQIDQLMAQGYADEDILRSLCDERDKLEFQFLRAKITSDAHAMAKMRVLAKLAGMGERSDGADVLALHQLTAWMEKRFQRHEIPNAKAA